MIGHGIGVTLALKQLWRAPWRGLLAVLLLVAALTPLLLVWSLKAGQVDPLIEGIRSNPSNLEISLHNDQVLSDQQLAQLRELPGLGYFQPTTRGLSLRAFLSRDRRSPRSAVGLLPSSPGDPLLGVGSAPGLDEAVLSEGAMERVGVSVGARVTLSNSRTNGTVPFAVELTVIGGLDAARLSGEKLLVNPQLAFELESYIDEYAVPRLGLAGKDARGKLPQPASARIYAQSLETVVPLESALEKAGFYASIANAGVALAHSLERAAQLLVLCIGSALVAGAAAAQWVGMALCFIPQRRQVALLRLMGAGPDTVFAYVLTLGLGIAGAGVAAAISVFLALSAWLNAVAPVTGAAGASLSRLDIASLGGFAAISLLLAASASLVFAVLFGAVQPSGALRDEMP